MDQDLDDLLAELAGETSCGRAVSPVASSVMAPSAVGGRDGETSRCGSPPARGPRRGPFLRSPTGVSDFDEDSTAGLVDLAPGPLLAKPLGPTSSADALDGLDDLLTEVLDAGRGTAPNSNTKVDAGSQPPHDLVENFQCLACDFRILLVQDSAWTSEAEYMVFRNYYPDARRLGRIMRPTSGSSAYCCQCSWRTCTSQTPLDEVEWGEGGNPATGLRWRVLDRCRAGSGG
eukprot:TRINITY_DN38481_c0_g1_i1.p1 TRINITY_DN38481_c0_g1~~TRINITY_DN38481_c0_g1_i1.p1  ORF type:complete len:231 (+),score=36.55 TRINITY_DN38481_c0_g1_i1:201-893(+)